jgi:ABC-2 type transport system permease protein
MNKAMISLIRNDIRIYLTDRRAVIVGILIPILIAAFFGYIFGGSGKSEDAGKIAIAMVDEDQSNVSRAITADLVKEAMLNVQKLDRASAETQVRTGKIEVAAVLPKEFGKQTTHALFTGEAKPVITLLIDPSKNSGARVVEGLLAQHAMQEISKEAFTGTFGVEAIDEYLGKVGPATAKELPERGDLRTLLQAARSLNNRTKAAVASEPTNTGDTLKQGFGLSIPYSVTSTQVTAKADIPYNGYAHSFAGMAVQFILFAGIDAGILLLLTRSRGIWQRIRSAPITKSQFLIARTLATTLISLFQFAMIYLAAIVIFKVRIDGNLSGFLAVAIAFCVLNAAFGLMLAAIGKSAATTRGLAMMATLLLVMIGGAWVPSFVFPAWLQSASRLAPTRWAVDGLDAMTWRGLPLHDAMLPIAVLIGTAMLCLAIAIWRFRWEE